MLQFDFLKRPEQDVHIDLPGVTVEINHRLKVVFLSVFDTGASEDAFADLEKHLNKRGYLLQVFAPAPPPTPAPVKK